MKKQAQISIEDAKLLLQSHPLASNLWLASSSDMHEIVMRLPDPSYSDSFNWPSYKVTKAIEVLHDDSPNARIDFVKKVVLEKAVLPEEFRAELESKLPQLEQELNVESTAEIVEIGEKESENQQEKLTAIHTNELHIEVKKEDFVPEEFEEISNATDENASTGLSPEVSLNRESNLEVMAQQESNLSKSKVKINSKLKKLKGRKLVKSTKIEADIEEVSKIEQIILETKDEFPATAKSIKLGKRLSKNLDFYGWLEELNLETGHKLRKKPERLPKTLIKQDVLPVDETRKAVESSLKLGEEIVLETLAKLLARQGHKLEAIEMYQKLASKYPEKGTTFAAAIQKLKS